MYRSQTRTHNPSRPENVMRHNSDPHSNAFFRNPGFPKSNYSKVHRGHNDRRYGNITASRNQQNEDWKNTYNTSEKDLLQKRAVVVETPLPAPSSQLADEANSPLRISSEKVETKMTVLPVATSTIDDEVIVISDVDEDDMDKLLSMRSNPNLFQNQKKPFEALPKVIATDSSSKANMRFSATAPTRTNPLKAKNYIVNEISALSKPSKNSNKPLIWTVEEKKRFFEMVKLSDIMPNVGVIPRLNDRKSVITRTAPLMYNFLYQKKIPHESLRKAVCWGFAPPQSDIEFETDGEIKYVNVWMMSSGDFGSLLGKSRVRMFRPLSSQNVKSTLAIAGANANGIYDVETEVRNFETAFVIKDTGKFIRSFHSQNKLITSWHGDAHAVWNLSLDMPFKTPSLLLSAQSIPCTSVIDVSSDDKLVAIAYKNGSVCVWNMDPEPVSGRLPYSVMLNCPDFSSTVKSPSLKNVAAMNFNMATSSWPILGLAYNEKITFVDNRTKRHFCSAIAHATGGNSGEIKIWDVRRTTNVSFGHTDPIAVLKRNTQSKLSQRIISLECEFDLNKALKRALGGGVSGAAAMVVQVLTLMPLRTVMNYQYKFGTDTTTAIKTLYKEGGFVRYYRGLGPALIQGPMSRFGDTASNAGALALLESSDLTRELPVTVKTVFASAFAAGFRMFLTPVDTLKTTMQIKGAEGTAMLRQRIKSHGIGTLWYGAGASAAATFVGHYPWFATYNSLQEYIPKQTTTGRKLARNAFIGFAASFVSDTISNSLRVIKTYRQTHEFPISYRQAVQDVVAKDGVIGLFGRGLKTRILTNGLQGIMFSVLWKTFEEQLFPKNK
ncbi:hypothetical protein HDU83_003384 [Entophlyctis luteolus]|nr:hypothetical protein HDU83_003384 [Entophlyctis luteolus]